MNNQNFTTLFLDIGGVLLSNGWGHEFRYKAAEKFCLDIPEMDERHSLMFVTYEEGKITLEEYLNRVVFYKARDFTPAQFLEFMFSLTTPDFEMIAFIKKIKAQYNLKIVAVSNEARELNEYRIDTFNLHHFIDFFVSSCYVHLRKPDATIFRMALDIAHVSQEQVIYIDDVELFTQIASELGIKSIHHTDLLSTSNQIKTLGLTLEENVISYA